MGMSSMREMSMKPLMRALGGITLGITLIVGIPSTSSAEVTTRMVTYMDGDTPLRGFMAWDDVYQKPRPGVLVVYEWWGHTEESQERAKRVASAGYVAFVPDIYGNGKSTNDPRQAKAWMLGILGDEALWNRRAKLGLDVLKSEPRVDSSKLAVLGSSFGGATALQMAYAGHEIDAAISIASSLPVAPEGLSNVRPRILVFHGRDDVFIKPERVAQFTDGLDRVNATWEMSIYSGAVHSFATPVADTHEIANMGFNETADRRAWVATTSLLQEVFE